MKRIIILVGMLGLAQCIIAQTSLEDSARKELYLINKVFDSSQYTAFDLSISYKSDSGNVTVETDQLDGNYVLNGHNMYYKMGSTVYLQTDSFSYNIYPDEKLMIMTKNFVPENSDVFPLKNFVDSMMNYYGSSYNITIQALEVDSSEFVKRIRFDKIVNMGASANATTPPPTQDIHMQYNYFYIDYTYGKEQGFYHPVKFEFAYNEMSQHETSDRFGNDVMEPDTYMAVKTVSMNFSNFRPMLNMDVFDDKRYVFYNKQRKIYEPVNEYKEYELSTAGFTNSEEDEEFYNEIPAKHN